MMFRTIAISYHVQFVTSHPRILIISFLSFGTKSDQLWFIPQVDCVRLNLELSPTPPPPPPKKKKKKKKK